ncbi:hypothetical protein [Crystallibacter degradans]|uniref:hypothetical protein n=1 Tax=Crystallibacter degradans TaxID=2726743 RepID=UPI001473CC28|nr:hypothetical protein [Arthrobacter sp. SF27]NMR30487.1 hypothetical protein [Arthrobacter sp. SF27]
MDIPRGLAVLAVAALALTGCGDSSGNESAGCMEAFAAADKERELQDTDKFLEPAFTACSNLSEFEAASEAHQGVLGNTLPSRYVTERCQNEAALAETPLCTSLGTGY